MAWKSSSSWNAEAMNPADVILTAEITWMLVSNKYVSGVSVNLLLLPFHIQFIIIIFIFDKYENIHHAPTTLPTATTINKNSFGWSQ